MKSYKELNKQANDMRNQTKDEIASFMLKQSAYQNDYVKVTKRKLSLSKTINTLIDIFFIGLVIYMMIMIPYIFLYGYPY